MVNHQRWKMFPPLLFTILILSSCSVNLTTHIWQFTATERGETLGIGFCDEEGCQRPISITFDASKSPTLKSAPRPFICFYFDQTRNYCHTKFTTDYGGCPYWSCVIHDAYNDAVSGGGRYISFALKGNTFNLTIKDPWDNRWQKGVYGQLYTTGYSSTPSAPLYIARSYIANPKKKIIDPVQNTKNNILKAEATLISQLPSSSSSSPLSPSYTFLPSPLKNPLPTWPMLIQRALTLLNITTPSANVSDCFLCASLYKPLLTIVPSPVTNVHNSANCSNSNINVTTPLSPFPTSISFCFYSNSSVYTLAFNCTNSTSVTSSIIAPPGHFFWSNFTLFTCLNATSPGPCLLVTTVPSMTLYTRAEFLPLVSLDRHKRAVFVPLLIGVSMTTALAAAGTSSAALGYGISSARDFEEKLEAALDSTTKSLAALQRQLTSLARVVLQNRRALDLLTADKGGACLFLKEDCCYYINESGTVEQNIDVLTKIKEDFRKKRSLETPSPFSWLSSSVLPYIIPIITPLITFLLILTFAPWALRKVIQLVKDQINSALGKPIQVHYHRLHLSENGLSPELVNDICPQ